MKTAREFLTEWCEKKGYDTDDAVLSEALADIGETVYRGDQDKHRWYICEQKVNELDGVFIEFTDYIITGDNSMSDMGLEYDLDGAKIVERKERQVTEVYFE